jgi:TonB-linked SusC/RagA family outer membrane protein
MRRLSVRLWLAAVLASGGTLLPTALAAQAAGQITGTITGAAGAPLSGVAVNVVGTDRTSQTGADGRYTITAVPAGTHTVRATKIGYGETTRTVTVAAGQAATLDFQLEAEALSLEGVVAVGYGTQRKINVTGAVDAVDGSTLTARPVPNVSQALQGVAPGVTVVNRGGAPGRDGADIKIRGVGTIGNGRSDALVLVDGVPVGNINDVAPSDIDNISVLKDAASAAIYGSRAANGVILITTKRGKRTGGMRVSYDGTYGIQGVTALPPRVGMEDYIRLIDEAYVNAGLPPRYSEDYIQNTIKAERGELPPEEALKYPHTDWVSAVYDPAPIQEHTVRVTGGNDLAAYSLSLNGMDQQGMVTNTSANRYGLRLNTDFNLSSRLKAGADVSLQRMQDSEPNRMGDLIFYLFHDTPPMVQAVYPDGTYGWSDTGRNSVAYAEKSGIHRRTTFLGDVKGNLEYELTDGLKVRALASARRSDLSDRNFRAQQTFYDYFNPDRVIQTWTPNRLDLNGNDNTEIDLQALLDYDRSFGDHNVSGLLGYDQIANDGSNLFARREVFYNNQLQEIDAGDASRDSNGGNESSWRLRSGFARLGYNYRNRYLLEGNARYDGSSRFAQGNRYGFFPSFSAGWRISEEGFLQGIGWLSDLKLRGSWGQLGNQDVGLYRYYSTIALGQSTTFGGQQVNGAAVTSLANPEISWETTEMTDLGFDAGFADGRLTFTGDVYSKTTSGILLTLPIPSLIGRSAPTQNAGRVNNRGWEANLSWSDLAGDFDYSIGLNLSDNRNKVLDLAGTGPYVNFATVVQEGQPINALWGWKANGLYQSQQEVDDGPTPLNPNVSAGDIRYVDINGDGMINNNDETVIGDPNPHYTFGLDLSGSYRGFDASLFFQGVLKVDAMVWLGLAEGPDWANYTTTWALDRWTPDNPDATMPRAYYQASWNAALPSSFWVQNARYAKLKNMQIGYTLPASATGRIGVDRLRLYLTGQNLWSTTNMRINIDPEIPNGFGTYYPQTRTVSIGTSVSF